MGDGTVTGLLTVLASDVATALATAFTITPMISIMDKAIIENAAGRATYAQSMSNTVATIFKSPFAYVRRPEFLLVFAAAGATYGVANSIDTFCDYIDKTSNTEVKPAVPELVGTTATAVAVTTPRVVPQGFSPVAARVLARISEARVPVRLAGTTTSNLTAGIYRDTTMAKIFGNPKASSVPLPTIGNFMVRDGCTIAASFTLPPVVGKMLAEKTAMPRPQADMVAQLTMPCAIQIIGTPFHLLGLDYINRPGESFGSRLQFMRREYAGCVMARMMRMLPAFGIGGVLNKTYKKQIRSQLPVTLTK